MSVAALTDAAMTRYGAGQYAEAITLFRQILAIDPCHLAALYQIANAQLASRDSEQAMISCNKALVLLPNQPDLLVLSAAIASAVDDHTTALAVLQHTKLTHPSLADVDLKISEVLCYLGRGHEAIQALDDAIEQNPGELTRKSNRLFFLNFFGLLDRPSLFEEHRKWGAMIDAAWAPLRKPHTNLAEPNRPLRVGIVSGDLRQHAAAYFISGYLREHDRKNFPIHCFDVSPAPEDEATAMLRPLADHWYRVAALDDDALGEEVRRHQIDVLVDLAGHTGHNRLLVFTQRPAPIQVSWFGYMNTTGLTSIDYRLTDASHDPPDENSQQFYTEKLFHLPSLACFTPDARSPAVAASPYLVNGYVTFVSANQWTKVTEEVKALWAEILCDPSRPRLRILARSAASPAFRQKTIDDFVKRGVLPEQIVLVPFTPIGEFLASFDKADIALDPFPYGGGTTTLHTIWMGVPIIALQGEGELGRATPAMLRGFGLPDFVAQTHAEYRDKAIALARDPSPLVEIRKNLRQRMAESTALDAKSLAHNVENAFRTMWHNYCIQASSSPDGTP